MTGSIEVTKCLGCGDEFYGAGLCADCVVMDRVYEARRAVRQKLMADETCAGMLADTARENLGVVPYEPEAPRPHIAFVLALLAGAAVAVPVISLLAWHFGRLLIAYLAGAR